MRRLPALLLAAGMAGAACSPEANTADTDALLRFPGASIVLISIDTLRADRLGCYGYERGTSPQLDALAEESILFEDVYANSPKTASSHMSLFTSLLPSAHKVCNLSARLGLDLTSLPRNRITLPQILHRAGYWTAAVASGANIQGNMGFARGFERRFESGLADVAQLVDRFIERVDELVAAEAPGFLFFHTYQVHGPYLPPREYMERFVRAPSEKLETRVLAYRDMPFVKQWKAMNQGLEELPGAGGLRKTLADQNIPPYWDGKESFGEAEAHYLSDLYDGEIAYTDSEVGRLLDALRESGLYDRSILVVLSDHGEEFREHGDFEHDQLFREHLHVPLLIRLPGGRLGGTRVAGLASLVDVLPTLLELLEMEPPPALDGASLVAAMRSRQTADRPVLAERVMFPDDYKATLRTRTTAVTFHARQASEEPATLTAFDLSADAREQHDLATTAAFFPRARDALHAALVRLWQRRALLDEVDAGAQLAIEDAEVIAELENLGYLGDGTDRAIPPGTPLDYWPAGPR